MHFRSMGDTATQPARYRVLVHAEAVAENPLNIYAVMLKCGRSTCSPPGALQRGSAPGIRREAGASTGRLAREGMPPTPGFDSQALRQILGAPQMNVRELNLQKKALSCLGCGRVHKNLTRCHRFCKRCMRRNKGVRDYAMQGVECS